MALVLALLVAVLVLPSEVTSENHIRPLPIKDPQKEINKNVGRNEVSFD